MAESKKRYINAEIGEELWKKMDEEVEKSPYETKAGIIRAALNQYFN